MSIYCIGDATQTHSLLLAGSCFLYTTSKSIVVRAMDVNYWEGKGANKVYGRDDCAGKRGDER